MLQINQYGNSHLDNDAPSASSLLEGNREDSDVGRVYSEIFDAVMDRRLLPGTKLTETTLCEVFSCSRTVVRGALAALAHDKIVRLEANRGAFVWKPESKETEDIFEMRRDIECLIIDKLLQLSDLHERLQVLYDMVARERQAFESGKRISWIRLSNAFHVEMAKLLNNHVLTELMHMLCARTSLIIAYHDNPGEQACSFFEHEEILNLLSSYDREGALQAMTNHLQACEHRINDLDDKAQPNNPWQAFSIQST